MKKSTFFFLILFIAPFFLHAQEINWRNLDADSKHIVAVQVGADYGTVYGFQYSYQLPFRHPVLVGAGLSTPFGNHFMDDYKVMVNAQTEVWHSNSFSFAVRPGMSMRRYHSAVASLYNIGVDITTTVGYSRPKWGIGIEAGYDWSRASYIEHVILKDYYPDIKDGWYSSTGGNFKFGIKGNYWMKSVGLSCKAGKVYGQNFSDNPTLPYYLEFSLLKRFK
jgi:hypothetical protein